MVSDTDESKSRLLEHEAARCLLSLSMTPPITAKQSQNLDNCDSSNEARRSCIITTFSSPKTEFNLLEHEKYYSNPNILQKPPEIIHKEPEIQSETMPIDLTKPKESSDAMLDRRTFFNRSNSVPVHLYSTAPELGIPMSGVQTLDQAGVLTSLVSIMDKFEPKLTNNNLPVQIDESKLLQQYLTEKALQDSKIKRSQMIRGNKMVENFNAMTMTTSTVTTSTFIAKTIENFSCTNNLMTTSRYSSENNPMVTDNSHVMQQSKDTAYRIHVSDEEKVKHSPEPKSFHHDEISESPLPKDESSKSDNIASSMDTLAEIAAGSVKLDILASDNIVPPILSNFQVIPNSKTSTSSVVINDSAKNVASEYLKIALNAAKRSKVSSIDDDDMSESDHDDSSKLYPPSAPIARTVFVGEEGFRKTQPTDPSQQTYRPRYSKDGPLVCTVCSKTFNKESFLLLHSKIHFIERQFRCEPCGISFRTKGHLQKHERSVQHDNKVSMTSTFGVVTDSNPRPFKCSDCDVAFRIHGHLAKHLRSKTHVQKLECTGKLPFGMCAEIERAGISLTDIDTKDCDNSLASLLMLAKKMHEKDPSKFSNWQPDANVSTPKDATSAQNSNMSSVSNNSIRESVHESIVTDSEDSDEAIDESNVLNIDALNRDSAFSSDSSSGSIKRKIDAITGSLDPILIGDENIDGKRLKFSNEI